MASAISVRVLGYVDEKAYTEYTLEVQSVAEGSPRQITHRFSDFLRLHRTLDLGIQFPCAKRWFHPASVKVERARKFEAYLSGLVRDLSARGELPRALTEFLAVPAKVAATAATTASANAASSPRAAAAAAAEPLPASGGASVPDAPAYGAAAAFLAQLGKVAHVESEQEWEAVLQLTKQPRSAGEPPLALVVDFTAPWCGPCQALAPRFAELAAQRASRALFVKVDVDELDEVAEAVEISKLPTFHLYENGELSEKVEGPEIEAFEKMLARRFDPGA